MLNVSSLFAVLLLQAVDPAEVAEIPEEEMIEAAAGGIETGLLDLVLAAGPFAQLVMLVLLGFSVFSWAIAFSNQACAC